MPKTTPVALPPLPRTQRAKPGSGKLGWRIDGSSLLVSPE